MSHSREWLTRPTNNVDFRQLRRRRPERRTASRPLRLESLEDRRVLAGLESLLISEFMAANSHTLADVDGEFSDWIEVHNPTDAPVQLEGWYLTDDAEDLNRWEFPARTLNAGDFLVVFASGKNRTDPTSELHTNFKLDSDGEYLALVQPDGVTVAHAYAPQFPPQQTDVSYGLSQGTAESALVAAGTASRTRVPTNGTLGQLWTQVGFSDAGWTAGTTGIGYDLGNDYDDLIGTDVQTAMYGKNSSVYTRIPFQVNDPASIDSLRLRMQYDDGFTAYLNGTAIAQRNAPTSPLWNSTATAEHGLPETSYVTQDFSASGTAYTSSMYGNGPGPVVRSDGPTGSYLRLIHDNVTSNVNRVSFDRVLEGPATRVVANFDFRMHSPTNPNYPADGFSFLLLPTSVYGTSGVGSDGSYVSEEPNLPNTFAIGFDTYPNESGVNDVSVHWNGVELRNVRLTNGQLNLDAGVFHRVHVELIEVAGGMQVTVTLIPDIAGTPGTPITAIDHLLIPGMQPYESRVEFSGRTGGLFMNVDLDNIGVQFDPQITELEYQGFDVSQYRTALRAGTNILAVHGLNVQRSDSDMLIVPELFAIKNLPIQPEVQTYFNTPTPGDANRTETDAPTEPPVFSRASGTFVTPFALTLTASTPLATIRYTNDGSIPTESSAVYTGPLQINTTTLIRARAYQEGFAPSSVVSHGYLSLDSTIANFSSDLPLIVLDSFGMGLGDTWLTPVTALFIEPGQDGRASVVAEPDFAGRAGLRIRGQSSQGFPKKQYAFETWAEGNEDTSPIPADAANDLAVSLLGLPAESDWVINGPYSDKSLMRNYLAYNWSNAIDLYAPRTQFVEVFVNTNGGALNYDSDYVGVYIFVEKIKRDPERVAIEELTPGDNEAPEITGGYIYKKDKPGAGDQPWTTAYGQELRHVEPAADEITPQQQAYLEAYINNFEQALYGQNFTDPASGYAQYIDVGSFIDNWILVEMTKNIDGFRLSTYYHKDRGGKIEMGPIWDYDLSLGNADYLDGGLPTGWYHDLLGDWDYPYWRRLFQDPEFEQQLVDRWSQYRLNQFSTANLLGDLDAAAATISEAQARNFQTWNILGQYVWPNYYVATTWQQEIDWTKGWLQSRVEWMDSQFVTAPQITPNGGTLGRGRPVTMTAPAGTIYYTLDGSDPRALGGGIAPAARAYTGPITLSATTLVRARAWDPSREFEWSTLTETPYHYEQPPLAGDLAIVEINYHPSDPTSAELALHPTITASAFEFLELMNTSAHAVSLLGTRFSDGIECVFDLSAPRTLNPGERLVVAANPTALTTRYSAVPNVVGPFTGLLDNAGELLRLVNAVGTELIAFTYADSGGWPSRADGLGSTLERTSSAGDPNNDDSWRPSAEYGGSPGYAGTGPLTDVVVNEVLSHTDLPDVDAIELHNTTTADIDISYWWLSDADPDYQKYQIPAGTILPAGGYRVFDESDFNRSGGIDPDDFGLDGAHGDEVWLLAGNVAGKPTRFVDHVTFIASVNGESFGRWPNGSGDLYPMRSQTLGAVNAEPRIGATNSGPRVGPIIISEIHYNPTLGSHEFIELFNTTSQDVPLYDPLNPTHTWKFDGVDFAFPAGTVLAGHSVVLVVSIEPALFRAAYQVPAGVPIFGPYGGALDNAGERLRLLAPDEPPSTEPDFVPYLLADEARYDDETPWPIAPDGTGDSLQRISRAVWGNDSANWYSGLPTPGHVPPSLSLANAITTLPDSTDTSVRVKVADIVLADDRIGTHVFAIIGADAAQFEIVNTALYLKAGTVLKQALQPSLSVGVTVDDPAVGRTPDDVQVLTISVTHTSWQNPGQHCDVNDDSHVTPLDALLIINYLNNHPGSKRLPPAPAAPPPYYDVTNDEFMTPLDALTVINYLNAHRGGASEGEGESESIGENEGEAIPNPWLFADARSLDFVAIPVELSTPLPDTDVADALPIGAPDRSHPNAAYSRDTRPSRRRVWEDSEKLLETLASDVASVRPLGVY